VNTRLQMLLKTGFQVPKSESLQKAVRSFSFTEKIIFWCATAVFMLTTTLLLMGVNKAFLVSVPVHGGELIEGVVGSPRFVNPLLALSDADKDLVSLVYSGLMKATPDGTLVPNLAESYSISSDGRTYAFILKPNVTFHDGVAITASDVEFTVQKAQDPSLKSPRRANWDGVSIEKISDREIHFVLKQAYAPFLENTTLGILPKHIWKNASPDEFAFSEYNVTAIGSGPYMVKNVLRNNAGIPNQYTLKAFTDFESGEPYITTLTMRFYQNGSDLAAALDQGDVESANSLSADTVRKLVGQGKQVEESTLPRIFGVFFNQSHAPIFTRKEVRQALSMSVDKTAIVQDVLSGYATAIDSPIPPKKLGMDVKNASSTEENVASAKALLEKNGWAMNSATGVYEKKEKKEVTTLTFSLATGDAPELKAIAEKVKNDWAKIGAKVEVTIFETGNLNQNIIRPRKYDALLFGEIVGRDHDLYPFWHSSQRNDPGLNIALYVNSKVDKLLEDARTTTESTARDAKHIEFDTEIKNDVPVVFLYSPSFLYVVPNTVENVHIGNLTTTGDRFLTVNEWYIEKNNVWKLFTK